MLIDKLFYLVLGFLVFAILPTFFLIFLLFGLRLLALNSFLVLSFVVVGCFVGDVAEFMHFHELFDPLATIVQHCLLYAWFLDLLDLLFQPLPFSLKLFFTRSLNDLQVLSLLLCFFE